MERKDLCKKCELEKFTLDGVSLVRGIKFFKCFNCGQNTANYADGQTLICGPCSEKLGKCLMCGSLI